MGFSLSARSLKSLEGVHPDMVKVVKRAIEISKTDFLVVEGLRTIAKQKEYFAKGKSKTMRSRHLTGHAVDLCPILDTDGDGDTELSWNAKDFGPIAKAVLQAAKELNVIIEWGGAWTSFVDMPHFQLPWKQYP